MFARGAQVPDSEAEDEAPAENGVREEDLAGGVHTLHDRLVPRIRSFLAEAYHGEWRRRHSLEPVVGVDHSRELPSPADLRANDFRHTFAAEIAHHEPKLQGAETPAQR